MVLAQIGARMRYAHNEESHNGLLSRIDVRSNIALSIAFFLLHILVVLILFVYPVVLPELWLIFLCIFPLGFVDILIIVFVWRLGMTTRKKIREKYEIKENRCEGIEDSCVTTFCLCCSVSQMMRHTADYR